MGINWQKGVWDGTWFNSKLREDTTKKDSKWRNMYSQISGLKLSLSLETCTKDFENRNAFSAWNFLLRFLECKTNFSILDIWNFW